MEVSNLDIERNYIETVDHGGNASMLLDMLVHWFDYRPNIVCYAVSISMNQLGKFCNGSPSPV